MPTVSSVLTTRPEKTKAKATAHLKTLVATDWGPRRKDRGERVLPPLDLERRLKSRPEEMFG